MMTSTRRKKLWRKSNWRKRGRGRFSGDRHELEESSMVALLPLQLATNRTPASVVFGSYLFGKLGRRGLDIETVVEGQCLCCRNCFLVFFFWIKQLRKVVYTIAWWS
jgi:hypothetical protein